jgi:hypothetical protein
MLRPSARNATLPPSGIGSTMATMRTDSPVTTVWVERRSDNLVGATDTAGVPGPVTVGLGSAGTP